MTSEQTNDVNSPENIEKTPEAVAVEAEADAVDQGLARLAEQEAEIADLKDRLLRAAAETENVRRRLEREKTDAAQYGATAFARDMLSVADNLSRALAAFPAEAAADEALKPLFTGIEMTMKELSSIFQRHGISRIEALGQPLDPNRHQAMMEIESVDAAPGTIVQELQVGYMMRDRLLRPALVGVAKASA